MSLEAFVLRKSGLWRGFNDWFIKYPIEREYWRSERQRWHKEGTAVAELGRTRKFYLDIDIGYWLGLRNLTSTSGFSVRSLIIWQAQDGLSSTPAQAQR